MNDYRQTYERSMTRPEDFWGEAAQAIDWHTPPTRVLQDSNPPFYRWFEDGVLNTCHNCLDRHVEAGRGDQPALIYDSPVTGTQDSYTYERLRDEVAHVAGALRGQGVGHGDRVIIYMPMIPEALIAMLACARLGAVHSVVFGGFAPHELALRIDDARPSVMIAASCGIEGARIVEYKPIVDRALQLATHEPTCTIVVQREQAAAELSGHDLDWHDVKAAAQPTECVPVAATDPLYILYTSGTTGKPKGVVRDNGGHAVALQWSMTNIFDTGAGEVMFTASDVGWVVGHSYIVYAPLLTGATTVMYEGKPVGTPDAGAFWRVVADHRVKTLFTAPTAFRAIKKQDPDATHLDDYDISSLAYLFLAGERLDPDTYEWAHQTLGVPVIDHWWQTETGWPIVANPRGLEALPIKPGSATVPVPGWDVRVLDPDGNEQPPEDNGAICMKLPLPPGALTTLWEDDERFLTSYMQAFPGYYLSGDGGYIDADGYVYVMGRTDDVINVAGHRLSTGAMEAVLAAHPAVAECAVIGVHDDLRGQTPRGFVVIKGGYEVAEQQLQDELIRSVREQIGAVAVFKDVRIAPGLPKTRSGKIRRRTMRGIAEGDEQQVPSTIEDTVILEELRPILRQHET